MTLLPQNKNTTEHKIESQLYGGKKPRDYLGMSSIGIECLRCQWYNWRWAKKGKVIARINRIFNRGHAEEQSVITDLRNVGIEVFRRDKKEIIDLTGAIGKKQEEIIGFHQHCKGHPDGRCLGVIEAPKTEHLLEIKTMNENKFNQLAEFGIAKAFPVYNDQTTMYMGKLKLKRTLFIATNKNTQARKYIRLKFNPKRFQTLVEREEAIILSEQPPAKQYKADHYLCNWCNHYQICHFGAIPEANCRTCKYVDLLPKGEWACSLNNKKLSSRKQFRECGKYKRLF